MATKVLSPKDAAEVIPVTFDFSNLVTTIDSAETTTVTTYSGIDATPSSLIQGDPIVSEPVIVQMIRGGVNGNSYKLRATIVSGSEKYVLSAILPVTLD